MHKGYAEVRRTFRDHLQQMEQLIIKLAHGNPLRELELADGLAKRFGTIERTAFQNCEAWGHVSTSLRTFFETLRSRYPGRFPNEIRAIQQGVCAAISNDVPASQLHVVSKEVGAPLDRLKEGQQYFDN